MGDLASPSRKCVSIKALELAMEERNRYRSALRQIRERATSGWDHTMSLEAIAEMTDDALRDAAD